MNREYHVIPGGNYSPLYLVQMRYFSLSLSFLSLSFIFSHIFPTLLFLCVLNETKMEQGISCWNKPEENGSCIKVVPSRERTGTSWIHLMLQIPPDRKIGSELKPLTLRGEKNEVKTAVEVLLSGLPGLKLKFPEDLPFVRVSEYMFRLSERDV